MCIPVKWGLGFLTEILPPLKQFRCLGRFSWIFYYVSTVFTATYLYYLYRIARKKGYGIPAMAVLIIILSFWGVEAASRIQSSTKRIFNKNEILSTSGGDIQAILKEAGKNTDEFQGIFFLPFANTCGDKLLFERGLGAFSEAMRCSDQTGLPIIQSFSPRLSFAQAMTSIQLLADSCLYKQRVEDMNDKDILLVIAPQELNSQESDLLSRAEIFRTGSRFSLATLPVRAFNQGYESWIEMADTLEDNLALKPAIYRDYENSSFDRSFTGKGSLYLKKGSMELFSENLHERFSDSVVELSFWLYVDHRTDNMPTPELWQWDSDNKLITKEKINSREVHNVDGMWVRINKEIIPQAETKYQLTIRGKYITVDDLLVKPKDSRVMIRPEQGDYLLDNFRVPVGTDH